MFFTIIRAPHISGGISAHHQELINPYVHIQIDSASNRNEYQVYFLWVKAADA